MAATPDETFEGEGPRGRAKLAELSRHERAWLKRRVCAFCEAPLIGNSCYAYIGKIILPVVEGVRDKEETVDLGGTKCDMDLKRANALLSYKPRVNRRKG